MAKLSKKLPSTSPFQGEISLDRERFPYTLKIGEKPIAAIYTSRLNDVFLNLFQYTEETNRLKRRVNSLITLAETQGIKLPPDDAWREDEIDFSVQEDAEDLFKLFGLRIGQIYKSKKSDYWYELESIDSVAGSVVLHWLGEPEYTREVAIKAISRSYVLWEDDLDESILNFCRVKDD